MGVFVFFCHDSILIASGVCPIWAIRHFLSIKRSDSGIAHLPADAVDLGQQLGRQLSSPGIEILVELGYRSHTDDGAGHLPLGVAEGQCQLRGSEAVLARQRVVAARCGQRIGATQRCFCTDSYLAMRASLGAPASVGAN